MRPSAFRRDLGFTIIELLVVISIIALLMSLLMPVLGGVREAGRRSVCATNVRSVSQATLSIALDNDMRYFMSDRSLSSGAAKKNRYFESYDYGKPNDNAIGEWVKNKSDHVTWLNADLFEYFIEVGLDYQSFNCPNRDPNFVRGEGGDSTRPQDLDAGHTRWRTNFYFLAGRNSQSFGQAQGNRWVSPLGASDSPDLPMMADIMELGTLFKIVDGQKQREVHSHYAHGPKGYVEIPGNAGNARPENNNIDGSNIGYNDGSVVFEPMDNLAEQRAIAGGAIRGWWTNADSYGN